MGLLSKEVGVIDIISILLGIAVGIIAGYFVRKNIYESKIGQANSEADRIIKQAEDDSKRIHKEKLLEAQEEIHKLRTESERENKERRSDLQKFERRVIQKEEILDKKLQNLEQKETSLGDKLKNVAKKEEEIEIRPLIYEMHLTDDQGILREKLPVNVPDKVYQKFSRIYQHREPIPQMREYLAYGFREEHRYGEEDLSVESVEIGMNSFTKKKSCIGSESARHFYLKDCPAVKSLKMDRFAFSDYTVFDVENVDALETIEMGGFDVKTGNFFYAAMELRSILIQSE